MRTYFNFPEHKVIVFNDEFARVYAMEDYLKNKNIWGEFDKMVKLNEVVKDVEVFTDCEKVKSEEVKMLDLRIKAIAKLQGKDGEFLVIKADAGKQKDVAFSNGGKVVVEKLLRAVNELNVKWADNVSVFSEPLETRIIEKKSENGRVYYDLE